MSNSQHVGQFTQDHFGNFQIAKAKGVVLSSTGNAVANISILDGGLSSNTGCFIPRRVTVMNANSTCATGNVIILTSNDGNLANAITANTLLSNVVHATTDWQDMTLAGTTGNVAVTASAVFVYVTTAVAAKCDIAIYGDVVNL